MKTYSVALLVESNIPGQDPYWVTNWNEYSDLGDINWASVKEFYEERTTCLGYGYYHGHKSSGLTSARCRTVLQD